MNLRNGGISSWFPLAAANSGLGFDFAVGRGFMSHGASGAAGFGPTLLADDSAAITRLDEVRTADLMLSRGHLNPPTVSPAM